MPARRLPWFKLWPESMRHEKIVGLSDGAFRTWVVVLASGSEQAIRWRFASLKHATAVTGRPAKHLRELIACRLIDETAAGELWVHDWRQWQDRYDSDFAPRTVREDSAITPRTLRPELRGEREKGEEELDVTQPKSFPPSGKDAADAATRARRGPRDVAVPGDVVVAVQSIATNLGAKDFHDAVETALTGLGFECWREVLVPNRGDGRPGRVDLIAERGQTRMAIELDDRTPREKSVKKLACVNDAVRVIVLRCPFEGPLPKRAGVDWIFGAGRLAASERADHQPDAAGGAPGQTLAAPTEADAALWAGAQSDLTTEMSGANWETYIAPLAPIGRAEDGGMHLRAPPGLSQPLRRFRSVIARALADAGDPQPERVVIVEARPGQE